MCPIPLPISFARQTSPSSPPLIILVSIIITNPCPPARPSSSFPPSSSSFSTCWSSSSGSVSRIFERRGRAPDNSPLLTPFETPQERDAIHRSRHLLCRSLPSPRLPRGSCRHDPPICPLPVSKRHYHLDHIFPIQFIGTGTLPSRQSTPASTHLLRTCKPVDAVHSAHISEGHLDIGRMRILID
jgi:hypothetical protein